MAPLITLLAVTAVARVAGIAGVDAVSSWGRATAIGLAAMFLLTGLSRLPRTRRDGLIAIVPPSLPGPAALVWLTGALEVLGALGLLVPVPGIRTASAIGLVLLLIAVFPANVRAARARRSPNSPTTPLARRTAMQIVFVAAAAFVVMRG